MHLMHGAYADTVAYGVEKANAAVEEKPMLTLNFLSALIVAFPGVDISCMLAVCDRSIVCRSLAFPV